MDITIRFLVLLFLAVVVAFFASFFATPFAIRLAHKIGAIDVPKDKRRMHKEPIPRLGGLAIVLGFVVSVICFCELPFEIIGVLIGGYKTLFCTPILFLIFYYKKIFSYSINNYKIFLQKTQKKFLIFIISMYIMCLCKDRNIKKGGKNGRRI